MAQPTRATGSSARRRRPRAAAEHALGQGRWRVPLVGELSPDRLAFYGGLALLGTLELLEWPVVVAIGVGHLLATDTDSRTLRAFGDALEEA